MENQKLIGMTESIPDYFEVMDDYYKEETKRVEFEQRANNRILSLIEKIKGEKWFADFKDYIEQSGVCGIFKIVKKPKGHFQDEGYDHLYGVYVDQKTGYMCDDYYGTVTVKIKSGKYLEMPFSC